MVFRLTSPLVVFRDVPIDGMEENEPVVAGGNGFGDAVPIPVQYTLLG
jgi:hypothetical protein